MANSSGMSPPAVPSRPLSDEALDTLFRSARTANTFTDEPVSTAQIQEIYDLVKWGPTAMNQQPLRLLAVRSPEARARLVAHLSQGNKAKTLSAPLVFVLAADTRFHEHLPRTFPPFAGAKASFEGDEAKDASRVKSALFNATLQAGYVIVAIRAVGLAAGPMLGFDGAGIDAAFFPDGRLRTILVINVGRPGENAWKERLPRLGLDEGVITV